MAESRHPPISSLDVSRAVEEKTGRWDKSEDDQLLQAISELGSKRWSIISQRVPGRSPIQCQHRWNKTLKPGLVKGPWSSEEDQALQDWVKRAGPSNWGLCAKGIPGRSGKQCRERWSNVLDPDVKKGNWREDEDKIIFRLYREFGPKWTEMTKYLPERTENSIKNRFYSTIRKAKVKSSDESSNSAMDSLIPAPETAINLQVVTLLQGMQKLEELLSKTKLQIMFLEQSIELEEERKRAEEQASEEVLI
jgi:hypothetical protein